MINKIILSAIYKYIFFLLNYSIKREKYNSAIKILIQLCLFIYKYNINFADLKVEECMKYIAELIIKDSKDTKSIKFKKVIFYDYFALDERNLTLIYLEALINKGFEVVYVTRSNNDNINMIKIKSILCNSKIVFIDSKLNPRKQVEAFNNVFIDESPEIILVQTIPWDVIGMLPFYKKNIKSTKYMINITDHAFWIGVLAVNYFIEFRNYGYEISREMRNVSDEQLILLPYYPYTTNKVFKNLPFELGKNDKLILSGGSLHKIEGSPIFFELVKHILDKHKDAKFLFVGNGDSKSFEKFIKFNNYENRCYLLKERDDLDKIMELCRFYLSTFPTIGGLMAQYAVKNLKIPLALMMEDDYNNYQEDLFVNCENIKLTYTSYNELIEEIDRILLDEYYYNFKTNQLKDLLINKDIFNNELELALINKKTSFTYTSRKLNNEYIKVKNIKNKDIKSLFLMCAKPLGYIISKRV